MSATSRYPPPLPSARRRHLPIRPNRRPDAEEASDFQPLPPKRSSPSCIREEASNDDAYLWALTLPCLADPTFARDSTSSSNNSDFTGIRAFPVDDDDDTVATTVDDDGEDDGDEATVIANNRSMSPSECASPLRRPTTFPATFWPKSPDSVLTPPSHFLTFNKNVDVLGWGNSCFDETC
jgi:hypothetical protein